MRIENQGSAKQCDHHTGKDLIPAEEMADRIKASVDTRDDPQFVIMARTDALANEGLPQHRLFAQRKEHTVSAGQPSF